MATASKVQLSTADAGVFHVPGITAQAADKGSEVLQENHESHHIFFNQSGFHNHIAHHILTIYALGASPEIIQRQYDDHKGSQRSMQPLDKTIVEQMHDKTKFMEFLGNEKHYHNYLVFFQEEIAAKGWGNVINEHVLAGDEHAEAMLVRLYAGFLHPIIHLGFGVEFKQPAIIAEGLAQTAVHTGWIGPYLVEAEKQAKTAGTGPKSMVQLLDEIRADKKLSTAAHWDDGNKIRDGILVRAPDEMIKYASQWTVKPEGLEAKTAEMINANVYYTGCAQHPPKQIKFDFYFMHCVNASIFFSAFLAQPWLSTANKVRLLEWKGRLDLAMYASRRSPEPLLKEIVNYKPKQPADGKNEAEAWNKIFERVDNKPDDGHAAKLIRALAHGEQVCKPYASKDAAAFPIKGDMWLQLGNMVIDSVEDTGDTWVRSAGFDQAWEKYEDRPRL